MDKRFQVFVSSTYEDLKEERAEAMQALLELDCMPAGMELFPAETEEQWSWIKRVIDESDYYMVIIGGRYGSIHAASGYSYTEMEYRYAVEAGKPVIAFLHEDPSVIPSGKTEHSEDGRARLGAFKDTVQQRLCKFYNSAADLGAKVSRGITHLKKHQPATGWVRANQEDPEQSLELYKLRETVHKLQTTLRNISSQTAPIGDLAQGEDLYDIDFHIATQEPKASKSGARYWVSGVEEWGTARVSWNNIIRQIAGDLITSTDERSILNIMNDFLTAFAEEIVKKNYPDHRIQSVKISSESAM